MELWQAVLRPPVRPSEYQSSRVEARLTWGTFRAIGGRIPAHPLLTTLCCSFQWADGTSYEDGLARRSKWEKKQLQLELQAEAASDGDGEYELVFQDTAVNGVTVERREDGHVHVFGGRVAQMKHQLERIFKLVPDGDGGWTSVDPFTVKVRRAGA